MVIIAAPVICWWSLMVALTPTGICRSYDHYIIDSCKTKDFWKRPAALALLRAKWDGEVCERHQRDVWK